MYKTKSGITVIGDHDGKTLSQLEVCHALEESGGAALCADGHLGYTQPIGGVVGYRNAVSPVGVGFDIACGNLAVKTDLKFSDIKDRLHIIADDIEKNISFGVGRKNNTKVEHPLFDSPDWKTLGIQGDLRNKAVEQLGTVGSGNHYVDIMVDVSDTPTCQDDGAVWIGIHFGSRGLGHTLATKYMALAGQGKGDAPPALLNLDDDVGQEYLMAMHLAGAYAYAGREWVANKVRKDILGGKVLDTIHNHHNYSWEEAHNGEILQVVRKGATPAFPGQKGFVGGSMGDDAVIVEGIDSELSKDMLYSTIHGAGRIMGRNQAKKTFSRDQMNEWLKSRGVVLRGGDIDESPMAYRRLNEVLAFHEGTVKINNWLRPVIVAMAGKGDFDPFKD